jgi:hypothetical protein
MNKKENMKEKNISPFVDLHLAAEVRCSCQNNGRRVLP